MKGINSFDENGYWSRYSNDNWSVCKIFDDVLGYEYTLSGESFDALEVVDKLASLEVQLAARDALIERLVDCGDAMHKMLNAGAVNLESDVDDAQWEWDNIVCEYRASKDGGVE